MKTFSLFTLAAILILSSCSKETSNLPTTTKPSITVVTDSKIIPGSDHKLDYNLVSIVPMKEFKIMANITKLNGQKQSFVVFDSIIQGNDLKIQTNAYWSVPQTLDSGDAVRFESSLSISTGDGTTFGTDAKVVNPTANMIENPTTQSVTAGTIAKVNFYSLSSVNLKSFSVKNITDNVSAYDTAFILKPSQEYKGNSYDLKFKTTGLAIGTKKQFQATLTTIKGTTLSKTVEVIIK